MSIAENITREDFSYRGGGVELDLTAFGYEDEFLSAYQNYLGGGMLGSIGNSCTIEDWQMDDKLVRIADELREYYEDRLYELELVDEYNEVCEGRPVSYLGLLVCIRPEHDDKRLETTSGTPTSIQTMFRSNLQMYANSPRNTGGYLPATGSEG